MSTVWSIVAAIMTNLHRVLSLTGCMHAGLLTCLSVSEHAYVVEFTFAVTSLLGWILREN